MRARSGAVRFILGKGASRCLVQGASSPRLFLSVRKREETMVFHATCRCQHCDNGIEFETSRAGETIACPHCQMDTLLFIPPTSSAVVEKTEAKESKPTADRKPATRPFKISTGVMIGIGVFLLCALCFVSILIGENLQKHSEQTSEALPEKNLSQIFKSLKTKNAATKKPDYPPPPTSGVEFSAKLLINFPERVNRRQGWMDAKFYEIDNSPIDELMGDGYTSIDASFTVEDKNGDLFQNCLVKKAKFGDQLLQLQDGDYIRITGQAVSMATSEIWINVDSIQVIK